MNAATKPRGANPYVGPKPFGKNDPLYGRDREVRELRDLLISQRIVVFYSPSGAGKTSLIEANAGWRQASESSGPRQSSSLPAHAGLRWHLERARFRVLPVIRVNQAPENGRDTGVNRYVLSALLSLEQGLPRAAQRDVAELANQTLAEYLDAWPREAGDPGSDVLIFDQFEELLTLDPTDQQAKEQFLTQVGEVLRDGQRWALFSLREDHLGGLDPYVAEIPTHLSAAYRLDLLGKDAARQAMQRPAASTGLDFTDEAALRLVDDLRRVRVQRPGGTDELLGPYVEPVHLQVVCRRLWDEAAAGGGRIDPEIVAEYGNVDRALRHFYADAVETVAHETNVPERAIRSWFDEHLITSNGIRGQVIEEATQTAGLPVRAVDALVDCHLVRSEPRRGVQWLELAHDRLIAPILADNNDWYPINLSALQQAARLWQSEGWQPGFLLTGDALTQAEEWATDHADSLDDSECEFLAESRKQRDQHAYEATKKDLAAATRLNEETEARRQAEEDLRHEAEQRATEQAAAARRLRQRLIVAVGLGALALLAALGAFWGFQQAGEQQVVAEARATEIAGLEQISRSQLLAKQAEDERNREASLLLAAEALHAGDTVGARQTMLDLMQRTLVTPLFWEDPLIATPGGAGEIRGVAFAPDSRSFVSINADGSLQLWSTASDAPGPRATITGEPRGVAFAQQGKLIVTGGSAGVQLWDAATLVAHDRLSSDDVTSVAVSPDGNEIVFGGANGSVTLYTIDSATTVVLPPAQGDGASRVNAVAYSTDGWIAAGRDDGTISLWDHRTDISAPLALPASTAGGRAPESNVSAPVSVLTLAFDATGIVLAAGDSSGTITRWDVAQQAEIGAPFGQEGHRLNSLAFSPDGKMIAAADQSGQVVLWDAVLGAPIETLPHSFPAGASSVVFSPDYLLLAAGSGTGDITVWSRAGRPFATAAPIDVGIKEVAVAAFSPQATHLAAGDDSGNVRVCALSTRPVTCETFGEGASPVQSLAFSQRGDRLAWGTNGGSVTIKPLTGDQEPIHLALNSGIVALAFGKDDQTLLAGVAEPAQVTDGASGFNSVVAWNLATLEPVTRELASPVTAMTVYPSESTVAMYGSEATIWTIAGGDVVDPRPLARPTLTATPGAGVPLGAVRTLAFDPAGARLAAAGDGGVVWDVSSGEVIVQGQPFMLGAQALAFGPVGSDLVTGNARGYIRLWSVESGGRYLGDLGRLPAAVIGLGWSRSGTLFALDADGSLVEFPVDPRRWQAIACQAAGRGFTGEEIRNYFGESPHGVCADTLGAASASPAARK